jgi:predicted nucleotidyltransferase
LKTQSTKLRKKVAKEAAFLLYTLQEKEYKQAKKRAAQTLGVHVLPSNLEVAEELDKIAEEKEGLSRKERLLQMRREALKIMEALKNLHPKLVGSVWRGTIHKNSDIDITAFSRNTEAVQNKLQKGNFKITKTEWRSVTKQGEKETSFHIHILLSSNNEAEIVVRNPERMDAQEKCEIYGDTIKGLTYLQLKRALRETPFQKFSPK